MQVQRCPAAFFLFEVQQVLELEEHGDGLIVVHGDVGNDPGAGMTGGRIVINGRCPTPPPGVELRPLTAAEVKSINKELSDPEMEIPKDAVCLAPAPLLQVEQSEPPVSHSDLSSIGLVAGDHTMLHHTKRAILLFCSVSGRRKFPSSTPPPLPILPMIESGKSLHFGKDEDPQIIQILSKTAVFNPHSSEKHRFHSSQFNQSGRRS